MEETFEETLLTGISHNRLLNIINNILESVGTGVGVGGWVEMFPLLLAIFPFLFQSCIPFLFLSILSHSFIPRFPFVTDPYFRSSAERI